MREIRIEQTLTKRDEDSLNRYLIEISKIPTISPEEEVKLARRIKHGDRQALNRLVKANLRFVISVAKKYQGQGMPLSDLVNEGNIGLINAAEKFDETKGFKFISYAVWWIRQGILLALSDTTRMIRVPMNQVLGVQKIRACQVKLEQQLEREPTHQELAEAAEFGEKAVISYLNKDQRAKSLNEKIQGESHTELYEMIADANFGSTDNGLLSDSLKQDVCQLLTVLKGREKKIIMELYGICGAAEHSMDAVAINNDLSKERVRQLRDHSLIKLKTYADSRLREHL